MMEIAVLVRLHHLEIAWNYILTLERRLLAPTIQYPSYPMDGLITPHGSWTISSNLAFIIDVDLDSLFIVEVLAMTNILMRLMGMRHCNLYYKCHNR